jgi:hypothetical protein
MGEGSLSQHCHISKQEEIEGNRTRVNESRYKGSGCSPTLENGRQLLFARDIFESACAHPYYRCSRFVGGEGLLYIRAATVYCVCWTAAKSEQLTQRSLTPFHRHHVYTSTPLSARVQDRRRAATCQDQDKMIGDMERGAVQAFTCCECKEIHSICRHHRICWTPFVCD